MKFSKWWTAYAKAAAHESGRQDDQPTPADVAGVLLEAWMAGARIEAWSRLQAMQVVPAATTTPTGARFVSAKGEDALLLSLSIVLESETPTIKPIFAGVPPTDLQHIFIDAFQAVHNRWGKITPHLRDAAKLKHPLATLIEGWLKRPEVLRPAVDKNGRPHRKGIIPSGLFPNPPGTMPAQLALIPPEEMPALGRIEMYPHNLPLFAEMMVEEDLPITPLILANAAGFRGLNPGAGARYDKRLLIFSLLAMPLSQRRPGGLYEWRPTLREVRDLLFPPRPRKGKRGHDWKTSSYRPSKHAAPLHNAMQAVTLAEVRLPDGYHWRPVMVRGYPAFDRLDSRLIVEIKLPDGSDRGPQVDKQMLAEAGTISDPAFDLHLGLAYLWDEAKARNGGARIYATRPEVLRDPQGYILNAAGEVVMERGRPAKRWNHLAAVRTGRIERNPQADKVRVLTTKDRHQLVYGVGHMVPGRPPVQDKSSSQLSHERAATDRLIRGLEIAGRIVIEQDAVDSRTGCCGWRILESWPGD